jgi:hypothetical protein
MIARILQWLLRLLGGQAQVAADNAETIREAQHAQITDTAVDRLSDAELDRRLRDRARHE